MGSGQTGRSRGNKPSAWPMNFKARWRERSKAPAHVTASGVFLGLHPHSRPAFPTSLSQVGHLDLPAHLGGHTTGAGKGGLCHSPKPGQIVGSLARALGRAEGPLWEERTDFLQHPKLTEPQQQQEQGHGRQPPHDLEPGWGARWGTVMVGAPGALE